MTLTELPTADFSEPGIPAVLNDYFTGELYDGTAAASRNMARMQGFMARRWLEAYRQHTELFERLPERVGLPESGHRTQKHDRAVAAYFRRAFGTDAQVAEALFGVTERHFDAFKVKTTVDYVVMLAYAGVDIELVEDLRVANGEALSPPWPTATSMRAYPEPQDARALVRHVTRDKYGYGLIMGGVSASAVKAFHAVRLDKLTGEEKHGRVAEASFRGVPAAYAVAAVSAGVLEPDLIVLAHSQGIAPEYLVATT